MRWRGSGKLARLAFNWPTWSSIAGTLRRCTTAFDKLTLVWITVKGGLMILSFVKSYLIPKEIVQPAEMSPDLSPYARLCCMLFIFRTTKHMLDCDSATQVEASQRNPQSPSIWYIYPTLRSGLSFIRILVGERPHRVGGMLLLRTWRSLPLSGRHYLCFSRCHLLPLLLLYLFLLETV